uniref:Uncharacterized LOC100179368 n=1 Tax=Ciona intestinalis TaxID=7719 RepID=F7ATR6_CIOIN|nr:uncharacterized protein LOC100179368 [Ciona intestinalis]|eukprot:XP_002130266.1 uncharacterized protein LOC100179368 [Ciona intestinalis]
MDRGRKPFVAALFAGALALILAVIGIATPEWTVARGNKIGLWTLTDENGVSHSWADHSYTEEFFYATWFMAVRGMMMAGVIIGSLGLLFNVFVVAKRFQTTSYGNILLSYYCLAFACLIVSVCVYSALICQPVNSSGVIIDNNAAAVEFVYSAGYGYSIWLTWLGAGIFLPAAGLAYEGGHQDALGKNLLIAE